MWSVNEIEYTEERCPLDNIFQLTNVYEKKKKKSQNTNKLSEAHVLSYL